MGSTSCESFVMHRGLGDCRYSRLSGSLVYVSSPCSLAGGVTSGEMSGIFLWACMKLLRYCGLISGRGTTGEYTYTSKYGV